MILSNDKGNPSLRLDEQSSVENPFLDHLESLGWQVIRLEQQQTPGQSPPHQLRPGGAAAQAISCPAPHQLLCHT